MEIYQKRLKQLIPFDYYTEYKSKPKQYFHLHMKKLKDDVHSIYWYSEYFLQQEFLKLDNRELKKNFFDPEIFRHKYIALGKMELFYRLICYIEKYKNLLFCLGDRKTDIAIEYLFHLMNSVRFYFPISFTHFESIRIEHMKEETLKRSNEYYSFQNKKLICFLQIFYHSKIKRFNLDPGILQLIYNFL